MKTSQKSLRLFVVLGLVVALLSCQKKTNDDLGGANVSSEFLSQYNGTYTEVVADKKTPTEKISIQRDGSIEVTRLRDVGQLNNPATPPGTICSYILRGQVRYIVQTTEANRTKTDPNSRKVYLDPATHKLNFTVFDAELTDTLEPTTIANRGCQAYLANIKNTQPTFTYGMELFGPGNLRMHTKDNTSYTGGDKTDLVLDEVYVRQ